MTDLPQSGFNPRKVIALLSQSNPNMYDSLEELLKETTEAGGSFHSLLGKKLGVEVVRLVEDGPIG
jgi:hypothetical protein